MISIIIPTHNRPQILALTLQALLKQTIRNFEILIVGDCPIRRRIQSSKIHYFNKRFSQQGVSRNFAVRKAKGDIIVFIGDDIIVNKNFLRSHLHIHKKHPNSNIAALGHTTWHPNLKLTSYMKWLESSGLQFGYSKIKKYNNKFLPKNKQFFFFYTSNISLKKKLLKHHLFSPSFKTYGWEDIELGYRLTKAENLKIFYSTKALAYHYHPQKLCSLEQKMENLAFTAKKFNKIFPELHIIPKNIKYILLKLISFHPKIFKILGFKNLYYYSLSKKYFLNALKKINKNQNCILK